MNFVNILRPFETVFTYTFCIRFNVFFYVKEEDLQLMLTVAVYVSSSFVIAL
jgi:hypothetical protein